MSPYLIEEKAEAERGSGTLLVRGRISDFVVCVLNHYTLHDLGVISTTWAFRR